MANFYSDTNNCASCSIWESILQILLGDEHYDEVSCAVELWDNVTDMT